MNLHFLKRNHGSITTRLVLLLTFGTSLLWCAAVGYATYTSYQELNEAFDVALRETAYRLLPLAEDDYLGREGDDSRAIQRLMKESRSYISYQLRNASGAILLRARDAPSVPYDREPGAGVCDGRRFPPVQSERSGDRIDGHRRRNHAQPPRGRSRQRQGAAVAFAGADPDERPGDLVRRAQRHGARSGG